MPSLVFLGGKIKKVKSVDHAARSLLIYAFFVLSYTERQFYSRRYRVIQQIEQLAASDGVSVYEIAARLDNERREKNWTLGKYITLALKKSSNE